MPHSKKKKNIPENDYVGDDYNEDEAPVVQQKEEYRENIFGENDLETPDDSIPGLPEEFEE